MTPDEKAAAAVAETTRARDTKMQASFMALQQQRDTANNVIVNMQAELAWLQTQIKDMQSQLDVANESNEKLTAALNAVREAKPSPK